MVDAELLGVGAVTRLIAHCPRLKAQIDDNDKTPITDGHIDLYEDNHQTNATLAGRVTVQVKGRAHRNKKIFKKPSTTFPVSRDVLRFLRNDGGGVYFYVAINAETRAERVFYAVLNPFKLDRLLGAMKADQKEKSISLRPFPESPQEIERVIWYALQTKSQDMRLGFDDSLLTEESRLTIHSLDGLDLSRPANLNLNEADFAVFLHTPGGLTIPVDMDLTVLPEEYIEHERELSIRCGRIQFDSARVIKLDENQLKLTLLPGLTITLRGEDRVLNATLELRSSGALLDDIRGLEFFISASQGEPLLLGGRELPPAERSAEQIDALLAQHKRLSDISDLLRILHIPVELVDLSTMSDSELRTLILVHRALTTETELYAAGGGPGRFDLKVGSFTAALMVFPGKSENHWRFFDIFDPANREKFVLFTSDEAGKASEIDGTVYEGVKAEDLAVVLNLRLGGVVSAYASLTDRKGAYVLANRKVLHLIEAAEHPQTPQRTELLQAAELLNEWLIESEGAEATHLVNRWLISARQSGLSSETRAEIHSFRKRALRDIKQNSELLDACLAVLLGDGDDILAAIRELSPDQYEQLHSWPIWELADQGIRTDVEDERRPFESMAD
ncbi:hypothetical protein [Microbacterium sp. SL75]|uniref:hypothetical protein n=1 Tax=Microbacterium sp. SL75 TaxID=2995140 RepID=UPI00226E9430|nr:hypothetical protein [Microbacterium sp. SL75]WAC67775.1 hypothetical protein OVA17_09120 [Microbacterium sp. SL75]